MHINYDKYYVGKRVGWPRLKFFSKYFPIHKNIKPLDITQYIWPFVCHELGNDDVIQLLYRFLTMIGS